MEVDDANLLAATPATDLSQLSIEYQRTFAQAVEHTLVHVFGESGQVGRERVQEYFAAGKNGLSLFTFHLSPLQIARDLSSARDRELTEDKLARYLEIQEVWLRSLGYDDEISRADTSSIDNPSDQRKMPGAA